MLAFEFNTASATAICNLESGMGWVWKKDEAEEDNSNPRSDDRCFTTKIVKSHCTTEEVEPGKFIRKCSAALQPSFSVQQPSSVVLLPRYAALQPPTLQLNSAGRAEQSVEAVALEVLDVLANSYSSFET
ncbi:Fra a 1-associated protein [Camellia lanceoleosa]|uniref:Fra a 1-associated protein n=1 Tax=Camellia lanceoleosa TaxID=1840588 RepID=A0ACC0IH77_9ERIC|nr:Fra a 1-associated protein [Camellia lanceoleosa]